MDIQQHLDTRHWFTYADFYDRMAAEPFTCYVELGAWKGHSIAHLAKAVRRPAAIYTVDLFEKSPYQFPETAKIREIFNAVLDREGVLDRVNVIQECSWKAAEEFEDGDADFVFVDADHKYECVKKDIEAWRPKIRAGGIIAGHDWFAFEEVRRAVMDTLGEVETSTEGDTWMKRL